MPEPLRLLWPREARHLHLVLTTFGVVDPVAEELFAVETVDSAVQAVMEELRLQEGWSGMPDIDPPLRSRVFEETLRVLGLSHLQFNVDDLAVETRWVIGRGADQRIVDSRSASAGARLQERITIISPWTDLS